MADWARSWGKLMSWEWDNPEEWEDPHSAETIIEWLKKLGVVAVSEEGAFSVTAPSHVVLRTLPREPFTCGGEELYLSTPDGDMFVWIEDWLSGCIPRWMEYDTDEAVEYIVGAVVRKMARLRSALGPRWRLVLVQVGAERRASRLVFQR